MLPFEPYFLIAGKPSRKNYIWRTQVKSKRSGLLRNAFVLAVLLICQRGAMATTPDGQQKTTGQQLKTVNIVPDFLRFWDETRSDDEASCVRRFRQTVIAVHPELFKGNVVPLFNSSSTTDQDRGIAEYLKKVAPFVPAIRVLNLRLAQDLTAYDQGFLKVWPDLQGRSTGLFHHFDVDVRWRSP
jgi:hypothetical protein